MDSAWKVHQHAEEAWPSTPEHARRREVEVMREAQQRLRRPSREEALEAAVRDLAARLEAEEARNRRPAVSPSPIEQWRRANADALRQRAGQVVAIHPTRGIVAEGASLSEVAQAVRALGLTKETVIERVRRVASRQ